MSTNVSLLCFLTFMCQKHHSCSLRCYVVYELFTFYFTEPEFLALSSFELKTQGCKIIQTTTTATYNNIILDSFGCCPTKKGHHGRPNSRDK